MENQFESILNAFCLATTERNALLFARDVNRRLAKTSMKWIGLPNHLRLLVFDFEAPSLDRDAELEKRCFNCLRVRAFSLQWREGEDSDEHEDAPCNQQ